MKENLGVKNKKEKVFYSSGSTSGKKNKPNGTKKKKELYKSWRIRALSHRGRIYIYIK